MFFAKLIAPDSSPHMATNSGMMTLQILWLLHYVHELKFSPLMGVNPSFYQDTKNTQIVIYIYIHIYLYIAHSCWISSVYPEH